MTIVAQPGQRDALIELLLEASGGGATPGCRLYLVSRMPGQPDTIAVTEVWDDKAAHAASLSLPAVRAAISRGRPLIASMGEAVELEPVGGQGLG